MPLLAPGVAQGINQYQTAQTQAADDAQLKQYRQLQMEQMQQQIDQSNAANDSGAWIFGGSNTQAPPPISAPATGQQSVPPAPPDMGQGMMSNPQALLSQQVPGMPPGVASVPNQQKPPQGGMPSPQAMMQQQAPQGFAPPMPQPQPAPAPVKPPLPPYQSMESMANARNQAMPSLQPNAPPPVAPQAQGQAAAAPQPPQGQQGMDTPQTNAGLPPTAPSSINDAMMRIMNDQTHSPAQKAAAIQYVKNNLPLFNAMDKEKMDKLELQYKAQAAAHQAFQETMESAKLEETKRHDLAAEKNAGARIQVSLGNTGKTEPEGSVGRESVAGMVASGVPLSVAVPGYGKQATVERKQAREDAVKQIIADTGLSARDAGLELANREIAYTAGKGSEVQLTKMEGATRQAVSQLELNVKNTQEEMKKLKSSDISPVINAIARGEEKWTGDPAYSSLFYYMNATATESARILSGGQASAAQLHQGAAEEAKQWANVNMTPASFDSVAKAMINEGQQRLKTFQDAKKAQRIGVDNSPSSNTSTPNTNAKGWTLHTDKNGNKAYVSPDGKQFEEVK